MIHQKKFISEIFPNYCMTINDYLEESLSFTLVSSAILFSFSWDEATPVDKESSISYKDRLMLQHNHNFCRKLQSFVHIICKLNCKSNLSGGAKLKPSMSVGFEEKKQQTKKSSHVYNLNFLITINFLKKYCCST